MKPKNIGYPFTGVKMDKGFSYIDNIMSGRPFESLASRLKRQEEARAVALEAPKAPKVPKPYIEAMTAAPKSATLAAIKASNENTGFYNSSPSYFAPKPAAPKPAAVPKPQADYFRGVTVPRLLPNDVLDEMIRQKAAKAPSAIMKSQELYGEGFKSKKLNPPMGLNRDELYRSDKEVRKWMKEERKRMRAENKFGDIYSMSKSGKVKKTGKASGRRDVITGYSYDGEELSMELPKKVMQSKKNPELRNGFSTTYETSNRLGKKLFNFTQKITDTEWAMSLGAKGKSLLNTSHNNKSVSPLPTDDFADKNKVKKHIHSHPLQNECNQNTAIYPSIGDLNNSERHAKKSDKQSKTKFATYNRTTGKLNYYRDKKGTLYYIAPFHGGYVVPSQFRKKRKFDSDKL